MTVFWVLAPPMVLAALGLVFARKAVHSALCLAVVMIGLAVLYAVQGAPFLFAVQIIVYTGAIMMLFLFVLMLVGVEHRDSMRETLAGHRVASALVVLAFGALMAVAVAQTVTGRSVGLTTAPNGTGNVEGLSALLFGPYVLAFELTSALLITAALAAMVLAHRERLTARPTQATLSRQRLRDYAETGRHPGNPPTPGVLASSNAVDVPALLPDGSPATDSIAPSLTARGLDTKPSASTRPPGEGDQEGSDD